MDLSKRFRRRFRHDPLQSARLKEEIFKNEKDGIENLFKVDADQKKKVEDVEIDDYVNESFCSEEESASDSEIDSEKSDNKSYAEKSGKKFYAEKSGKKFYAEKSGKKFYAEKSEKKSDAEESEKESDAEESEKESDSEESEKESDSEESEKESDAEEFKKNSNAQEPKKNINKRGSNYGLNPWESEATVTINFSKYYDGFVAAKSENKSNIQDSAKKYNRPYKYPFNGLWNVFDGPLYLPDGTLKPRYCWRYPKERPDRDYTELVHESYYQTFGTSPLSGIKYVEDQLKNSNRSTTETKRNNFVSID